MQLQVWVLAMVSEGPTATPFHGEGWILVSRRRPQLPPVLLIFACMNLDAVETLRCGYREAGVAYRCAASRRVDRDT